MSRSIRSKRGQAFLKELLSALDAMPERRLIRGELSEGGKVCALGAVGAARGLDMTKLDPYDQNAIASAFGISRALATEIMDENDESGGCFWSEDSPKLRWQLVRSWVASKLVGCTND